VSHFVYRHGKRIEVEVLNPAVNSRQSKARRRETGSFAKVPLQWAAAAAKATQTQQAVVWVLLQHMAWRAKSKTFPFPNGLLERLGVERRAKNRALQKLERAGIITIKRRSGRAPVITLIDSE
jgi:DNA-binding MarR family transcriptional regulator